MLSRVADAVFWMNRYLERADNVARFIDVNENLTLDLQGAVGEQWAPLVYTTGDHEAFFARYGQASHESVLQFLTFDDANPNSIYACVQRARDNARAIREIISSAMWEQINRFYLKMRAARGTSAAEHVRQIVEDVKQESHLIQGIMDTTMSHGESWHFARLGQLLERADKTSRVLDVKYYILLPDSRDVGTPLDIVQWSALLKSASALEMYRRRMGRIVPTAVAEFLILDRDFPRALRYCLVRAEESLHQITGTPAGSFRDRAEQRLGRMHAAMDNTSIDDIISEGLHEFVDRFQADLNHVGDAIQQVFFAPPKQAAAPASELQQ
ncbi:MAG: alpha-E domain-containing protein [Planctomycetia bacterium]|nr:alpha-E domain-containing protein [Planctomycetia bacterium]